jgi:phosphoglycolate phosphatase
MRNRQAVFLDFDGVILETTRIKDEAYARIFADYPVVEQAMLAWMRANVEQSRFVKFRKLYELLGEEMTAAREAELVARYAALTTQAVRQAPFVAGAETFLHTWRGAPLRVLSGTPQGELEETIRRRGLAPCFASVHGAPPDKEVWFARLIPELGLDPARSVMVGDAIGDHRAATGAGLQFIGRVAPGDANPFPAGTTVISDLTVLADKLQ